MKVLVSAIVGASLILATNASGFSPDCHGQCPSGCLSSSKNSGGFYAGLTGYWLKACGGQ